MRGNRVFLLVSLLILTALAAVGCQEEEGTPTPEFVPPSATFTAVPPTETPTLTPPPTPTTPPETAPEPTNPPLATATLAPTQTPIPQVVIEVLNSEDGEPVSGATVRLSLPGGGYSASFLTLEDGIAQFVGFVPSSEPYTLDVSAVGFRPISVELTVTEGVNELTVQLESGAVVRITTEIANLRAGPGLTFDIVFEAPEGQVYPVIDVSEDGEWIQVVTEDGLQGWVFASLVEVEGDLSQFQGEETPAATPTAGAGITPTAGATITPTATAEGVPELTPTPSMEPVRPPAIPFDAQALRDDMEALQTVLVQMGGALDRLADGNETDCEEFVGYYRQVIEIQTYDGIPEEWMPIHVLYVEADDNVLDTNRPIYLTCLEGGGISPFNFQNARSGINASLEQLRAAIMAADELLAENGASSGS